MWMMSQDRTLMQSFSAWSSWDDQPNAEHNPAHVSNSKLINEFLGGLKGPQQHTYFQLLGRHAFE
jgi:hypothetical protein